jgi:Bacterial regulatory helix-turn-helix protein, lysR family
MLDGVTINQLRTFVAVCEEASFSGAARKLRRAQSAISHAISALESALGVELFERSARRPQLSGAGRSLLPDSNQPEDFRRWPVNRAALAAGSRNETPAREEARSFRAESNHK